VGVGIAGVGIAGVGLAGVGIAGVGIAGVGIAGASQLSGLSYTSSLSASHCICEHNVIYILYNRI